MARVEIDEQVTAKEDTQGQPSSQGSEPSSPLLPHPSCHPKNRKTMKAGTGRMFGAGDSG